MKIHSTLLGVFLALAFTTTLVASQDACDTSADCRDENDQDTNKYCNASLKKCITKGGCVDLSDCSNPANSPYFLVKCEGTLVCDGTCNIACATGGNGASRDTDNDAASASVSTTREDETASVSFTREDNAEPIISREPPLFCTSHSDCLDGGGFCASDGVCETFGGCAEVADCNLEENQGYPIAPCFGNLECNDRVCANNCSGGSDALIVCNTSDECSPGEYCTTDQICRPGGACFADADCSLPDNQFMAIECVGLFFCESNQCGKECSTFSEEPVAEAIPAVPSIPEFETTKEDGSAVSIQVTQCKMDSDCMSITTSTTRAAVLDSYCAHGVCTKHGNCFTDGDCINPSNLLSDKKCFGYLHCTEMGMCDRVCGEDCKNGSRGAQCYVNPCDSQPLCEGAVSCAMTTCDGECNALYYTADGEEFSCDNVVMPWDDNTKAGSPSSNGATRGETTTDSTNLDSSAVVFRGTSSYAALLVAVLAAAAIV